VCVCVCVCVNLCVSQLYPGNVRERGRSVVFRVSLSLSLVLSKGASDLKYA